MINVKVTVKKIGNSLGFVLPKNIVKEAKLKEKKQIEILLNEKDESDPFAETFGLLKTKTSATQLNKYTNEFEDM